MPFFDLALIFAEGHIAQPVQTLDSPMGSPVADQRCRIGLLRRKTGDGILHLRGLLALADRGAFQATDLSQAGPIEMLRQSDAGLQMPLDETAVSLARRTSLRERLLPLLLGSGGKSRAEIPLL